MNEYRQRALNRTNSSNVASTTSSYRQKALNRQQKVEEPQIEEIKIEPQVIEEANKIMEGAKLVSQAQNLMNMQQQRLMNGTNNLKDYAKTLSEEKINQLKEESEILNPEKYHKDVDAGYYGRKAVEGFSRAGEGIYDTARILLGGKENGLKAVQETPTENYAKMTDFIYNNAGKGHKLAGEVVNGVTAMAPTIAANLSLPGVGYAALGAQAFGSGTQQAYQKTGELGAKEKIYGLLSGLAEVGVEKLSGGIGGLGNGAIDNIASKLIKNGFIRSATGEGIEEAVTTLIDPYLQRLTYDKAAEGGITDAETWKEAVRSALIGSLTSMVLQGGSAAVNLPQTIQQNKENRAELRNSLEGLDKMLPTYENVSETATTEKNVALELPTMASQQAMLPTNQAEGKTAQNGNIEQIAKNIENNNILEYNNNRGVENGREQEIIEGRNQGNLEETKNERSNKTNSERNSDINESKIRIAEEARRQPIEPQTESEKQIAQKAKELGIKFNLYENGNDNFDGFSTQDGVFIDRNSKQDGKVVFSHELLHNLRQNNNSTFNEEIKPLMRDFGESTEFINTFNKFNETLQEEIPVNQLAEAKELILEEIFADYTAKVLANYDIDYGINIDTYNKLQNSLLKITQPFEVAFSMPVEGIIEEGINANKISYNESIYRNVRRALGEKGYQYFKENILDKLDAAKLDNVNMKNEIANELKNYVVDELGIKKDSKESELVQKYGEKEITLDELKEATPNWENVVKADKWFRNMYDKLIDAINKSRLEIYPYVEEKIEAVELELKVVKQKIQEIKENGVASYKKDSKIQLQIDNLKERINAKNEFLSKQENKDTLAYKDAERVKVEAEERLADLQDLLDVRSENTLYKLEAKEKKLQEMLDSEELWRGKRIPKRKDYYRHFQEMTEGFEALGNILATPAEISSSLSGISENTKPNAKWLGLAQRRLGNKTKYDAVGGFLNYLDSASYAINIDPEIKRIRDFTEEIRKASKDNTTANRLIEYLTDYANDLAGKTNPMDRYLQKIIPGGRKTMRAIGWLTNRIKSNAVLGNFNSAAAQILNLPQGLADIKNPKDIALGFYNTMAEPFVKTNRYKDSQFINERFNSDIYSQFDEKLINQPKKMAVWLLGALDEFGTKTIWNGEYSKAVDLGIADPVRYADYRTRDLVAGRGIGELSLNQKSKTIGLLAPFTVEVSNYWGVVKDFVDARDFGAIILLQVFGFLFNKGLEELGISAGTVDFIDAAIDAANTEGGIDKKIGRIAGEYLSNSMFGQQLASLYPENGANLGVYELPTRSELFGDADPTRMGTGSVLSKAITNPVTSVVLPWGGTQVNKTVQGLSTFAKGGSYSKDAEGKDKLKYPVEQNASNLVKSALFGKWSTPGARDYIDRGFKPLSANQTEAYNKAMKAGISSDDFFKVYDATRSIESDKDGNGKTIENSKSKKLKEAIDKATPKLSSSQRKILYDAFNVSKTVQGGNGLPTASDFKVTLPKANIKVEK